MAVDPKYIDLINAEIDGEISAADRAVLEEHLAGNPDARALRDELSDLCGALDAVESVEPPGHLKHVVIDAITRNSSSRRVSRRRDLRIPLSTLLGAGMARYAMAFAAGAILSYTFMSSDQLSRQVFDDVTGLVGTITEPDFSANTSNEQTVELSLTEIAGSVNLNRAGSILILDFDLASEDPIEIVADYDDRDIWFNGFAQLESQGTSIAAETGHVTVRMVGQRRYAIYLYDAGQSATTISLRFYAGGSLIHEGELVIGNNN